MARFLREMAKRRDMFRTFGMAWKREAEITVLFGRVQFSQEFELVTKLLHEVLTQYIERTFVEFLNREGIKTLPGNELVTDDDKHLVVKSLKQCTHNVEDDILKMRKYQRKQLASLAAFMCLETRDSRIVGTQMEYTSGITSVANLHIRCLFGIMANCTLFTDVYENIEEIVHIYLNHPLYETNIIVFKQLTLKIGTLITEINDTMLPDKSSFQDQLKELESSICIDSEQNSDIEPYHLPEVNTERITNIEADIRNPEYINWVKGTLSLKYVNEGVRSFTLMIFEKDMDSLPGRGQHFQDGTNIKRLCEQVEKVKGKLKYKHPCCEQCKTLFKYVVNNLRTSQNIEGFNNGKSEPVGGAWGIAKLFMPRHCKNINSPSEADSHALFRLIWNCMSFNCCSIQHVDQISAMRNKLMHSSQFVITDHDLKELFASELDFIKEAIAECCENDDKVRQDLVSSKEKIEQVRESEMDILTFTHRAREAMQHGIDCLKNSDNDEEKQKDLETKFQSQIERLNLVEDQMEDKTKLRTAQLALNSAAFIWQKQIKTARQKITSLITQTKHTLARENTTTSHQYKTKREGERVCEDLQKKAEGYANVEKLLINFEETITFQKKQIDEAILEAREQHRQVVKTNDRTLTSRQQKDSKLENSEELIKALKGLNGALAAKKKASRDLKEIRERISLLESVELAEIQKDKSLQSQKSNLEVEVLKLERQVEKLQVKLGVLEANVLEESQALDKIQAQNLQLHNPKLGNGMPVSEIQNMSGVKSVTENPHEVDTKVLDEVKKFQTLQTKKTETEEHEPAVDHGCS